MMALKHPDLLRELMKRRKLRQQDVAEAVTFPDGRHPTRQWISSLLKGRHSTTREAAEQIAAALGIAVDHLFTPRDDHDTSVDARDVRTSKPPTTHQKVSGDGTAPAGGRPGPELRGER